MSTRFILRRRALGPQPEIEIEEVFYRQLVEGRQTLVEALDFEQRYDLLRENFLALELAAVEWSFRVHTEYPHTVPSLSPVIASANRHVANLLSAAKAYVDQVKQDFAHLQLEPAFRLQAVGRFNRAYDSSKDYRFMEALRNHTQHRGVAVHKLSTGFGKPKSEWMTAASLLASKEVLEADGGFKSSVLAEMPAEVDVRMSARGYIAELSSVHIDLRKQVKPHIGIARDAFERAISQYATQPGAEGSAVGLGAYEEVDGKLSATPVPVLLDWDETRKALEEKNMFRMNV